MSFIYSDIIQTYGKKIARKCGYFNTGKDFELLVPYYSDIYDGLFHTLWKHFKEPTINSLTTFMYYPGAFTHYSYAIYDAIKSISIPTVEVHLSDIQSREDFRKVSVTAPACIKQISGMGKEGYIEAIKFLKNILTKESV